MLAREFGNQAVAKMIMAGWLVYCRNDKNDAIFNVGTFERISVLRKDFTSTFITCISGNVKARGLTGYKTDRLFQVC